MKLIDNTLFNFFMNLINSTNCSTKQNCVCINCLLKEKIPKECTIEDLDKTYCIKISNLINDIKFYFGEFSADEFWLSILSLRTYFEDFYKEIKEIISSEEYYRKREMLSSSMLIDWEGSSIFKKIFVNYLKYRNLHPNIDIYLDGQIYFYVDFRYRKNDYKMNWIDQPEVFCTIGLNYGKTSSSNLNKKFETEIPFQGSNNTIYLELFDLIRLVARNHSRNLRKTTKDTRPIFEKELKKFIKNIDAIIYSDSQESLKVVNEKLIPNINFMFDIKN